MYYRDKLGLSGIARRTSLSRNTVKKWLKSPEGTEPKYRRCPREGKLAGYREWLSKALEADAHIGPNEIDARR
jgi:transposase